MTIEEYARLAKLLPNKSKSPTAKKKPTAKQGNSAPTKATAKELGLPLEGDQVVIDLPLKVTTGTVLEGIKKLQSLFGRYWEKEEHGFSVVRKTEIQDSLSDLLNEVKAKEEQK